MVRRFAEGCSFAGPEQHVLDGQISKYGILDLSFKAPSSLLDREAEKGISLLQELGFIDAEERSLLDGEPDEEAVCLEQLRAAIERRETHLLVFLSSTEPDRSELTAAERLARLHDPAAVRFPMVFTVTDACVSNSSLVWINKHFYL